MSTPIQELNPDYVLAIEYPVEDAQLGVATDEAQSNLSHLITTLYNNGFYSQVRSSGNSQSNLLVFIKLSSSKFTELVKKDFLKNYEFGVSAKNNTSADRLRIIYHYLVSPESTGGLEITPGSKDWKFITSISPIAYGVRASDMVHDVKTNFSTTALSTNSIKEKFGVQVALYFEFLKFYIAWLTPLAVIGVASFLKSKQRFSLTYAFINLLWSIGFNVLWNRKQQLLASTWDVTNSHKVEQYNSELIELGEKGASKGHHSDRDNSRFIKQLAFIPIALGFVAVLVSYQLACFVLEIFLAEIYNGPGKIFLTLLPTILISVFVPILTIVYNAVTGKVLSWENHDNDYTKNNSILIKTFVLNFLTSYVPLIITSFIYLPFAHLIEPNLSDIKRSISTHVSSNSFLYKYLTNLKSQKEFQINQDRLNAQFFFFIVTGQVVAIIMKYVLPLVLGPVIKFVTTKVLAKKSEADYEIDDSETEKEWLTTIRTIVQLPGYNVDDDFRGLVLQYGYLTIFGPVWSLAPLVSIIFNLITFKLDNLKLNNGKYFKPNIPRRADSIHPWNHIILLLTWIGSVISPVVTVFYRHNTKPPKSMGQLALDKASVNISSSAYLIFVLFAFEHIFFLVYFVGSKISNLLKSKAEADSDVLESDLKSRKDNAEDLPTIGAVPEDGEWANYSVDSVLKDASAIPAQNVKKATLSKVQAEGADNASSEKGVLTSYEKTDVETTNLTQRSGSKTNPVLAAAATVAGTAAAVATTASKKLQGQPVTEEEKESLLEKKRQELEEKQLELQKSSTSNLEKIKDDGDRIIASKNSQGQTQFATIDNNEHISSDKSGDSEETGSGSTSSEDVTDANVTASSHENFVKTAQKTARDINEKVDNTLTNGKVNKKKNSLKKLLKKNNK